jgi:NTE family protein
MKKAKKIGLALGGGGARGFAHIGVLKVLEREGIRPDIIVGTSIGSIVGGAIASGMTVNSLEERADAFLESDLYRCSELKAMGDAESGAEQRMSRRIQTYFKTKIRLAQALFRPGILPSKDMEEFVNFFIPDIQIEETVIPFGAVTTDLTSGECVFLTHGSLRQAILASSSIPGALPPVEVEGRQLADGGVICTVPAGYAAELGADFVIAVSIDRDILLGSELQTAVDIYVRAGEIMGFHLEQHHLKHADLVIRPDLGNIHWTDFSQSKELIALGEAAARKSLPELRRLAESAAPGGFIERLKRSAGRLFAKCFDSQIS